MRCHEVDYKVILLYIQMVGVSLDPDEAVIAEADAMTYLEQDICFETKLGDGSSSGVMGKLFGSGSRVFTGESVFLTHSTTESKQKSHVAFAAPFPDSVISLNLAQLEEEVICQKDSFLAAALGPQVDIAFHKNWGLALLVGKASYFSDYGVTAWHLYMRAALSSKKH